MRGAEHARANDEFVLQFGQTNVKVETAKAGSEDKMIKQVTVSQDGSRLFVPPVEDTKAVLLKALTYYRRDGEPKLVADGPLTGAARLTYVAALDGKKLDPSTEMQAVIQAFRLLENPHSEPIMLVVSLIDAYEVFSGKRPTPLVLYFMTKSRAAACCSESSPYVMIAAKT